MMGTEENNIDVNKPAAAANAKSAAPVAAKTFEPPHLHLSTSPHIRSGLTVPKVMLAVIAALAPALAASVVFFGMKAIMLVVVCVTAAVVGELLVNLMLKRGVTVGDFSAVLTGLLLAFNLSPSLPLWMAALGSVFAIVVAKMVFGGLGCNFINPALAGRAFLMASYPAEMTHFPATIYGSVNGLTDKLPAAAESIPAAAADAVTAATGSPAADSTISVAESVQDTLASAASAAADAVTAATSSAAEAVSAAPSLVDAVSSATPLHAIKYAFATGSYHASEFSLALKDLLFGNVGGCIGETSAIALLIGGIFLMAIRVIDFRIPITYISTVFLLFWIANGTGTFFTVDSLIAPTFHILAGGLFLGAFFMATDPVTSPITPLGRIVFGVGCGAFAFIIRKYGGYPEGVSYSILLMNLLVPLIDRCTRPKIYGEVKKHG